MTRFQSYRADCCPSALGNALEALGIRRSHEELLTLCGTTANGTTPTQLKRAVKSLTDSCSLLPVEMKENVPDVALLKLAALLDDGRPVVLLVDNWEHYVAAVGRLGRHVVVVADSADLRQTIHYPMAEFGRRWGHTEVKRGGFWGLAI